MNKRETFGLALPLPAAIDALMYQHGTLRVLRAVLAGLLRAPMIRQEIDHMPDHLRRDIGLKPKALPPELRELMR